MHQLQLVFGRIWQRLFCGVGAGAHIRPQIPFTLQCIGNLCYDQIQNLCVLRRKALMDISVDVFHHHQLVAKNCSSMNKIYIRKWLRREVYNGGAWLGEYHICETSTMSTNDNISTPEDLQVLS